MQSSTIVLLLALGLFVGQGAAASLKNGPEVLIFEDVINQTLNSVIESMNDPLILEQLDFNSPEGLLVGTLSVTNAQLAGIKNIVATYINLNILSLMLEMTVEVSSINLNLKYDADLLLAQLIPLYGNGRINVNIEDIKLDISGKADLSNGISIANTKIVLHLGSTTFDLHGLLNNENFSALVSAALNDNFAKFVNDNANLISSIISPILEGIINGILHPNGTAFYDENMENLYHKLNDLENKPVILY